MNVFSDRHHNSLYNSLRILFEERLGGKLFTQVGLEWADDYWRIFDHEATRAQYLSLDQRYKPIDGTRPLNQIVSQTPDYYELYDPEYGVPQKALTLEQFKKMDIDIIIASIPQHIIPFYNLRNKYKPNARLIYQIGNSWNIEGNMPILNIMASAKIFIPKKYHSIVYHQEFSTSIFSPRTPICPPIIDNNIFSFINCFSLQDHFKHDWQLFQELEQLMPDWNFKAYGGQGRDGAMNGAQALADKMREARFIWHKKAGADGYGHIAHNAMAMGKPLIINYMEYSNKLAGEILEPDINCINADGLNAEQLRDKIIYFSEPEKYTNICNNLYKKFKSVVNFGREEQELRKFLDNLY